MLSLKVAHSQRAGKLSQDLENVPSDPIWNLTLEFFLELWGQSLSKQLTGFPGYIAVFFSLKPDLYGLDPPVRPPTETPEGAAMRCGQEWRMQRFRTGPVGMDVGGSVEEQRSDGPVGGDSGDFSPRPQTIKEGVLEGECRN